MVRVLIAASHPLQCTGYARVGCALANGLAERGVDVIYFGYQNLAPNASREIHPLVNVVDVGALTQDPWGFGESIIQKVVNEHKIDIVVLYNDVMVVNRFMEALDPKTKIITYLDLVHDNEDYQLITNIDRRSDTIWVFADHWKSHLASVYGVDAEKVHVLPHGIDPCFFPVSQEKARMRLGLPLDGFIVLNTNRNSYRKALDLTIKVFLELYVSSKKDVYLFLNNNANTPSGYDIPGLIQQECARLALPAEDIQSIMTRHVLGMPNSGFLSDETLNLLYNACDIGINTCVGEGFGLCNLEHASLGKPQLVNGVGGLNSIFAGNQGGILVKPIASIALCRGFCAHGGTMEIPDTGAMGAILKEWYVKTGMPQKFDVTRFGWKRILDAAAASIEKCARDIDVPDKRSNDQ